MLKSFVSIVALLLATFASYAGAGVSYGYQNKDGEIIFLESSNNSVFLPKVAAVLEQAGYSRMNSSLPTGSKMDAWCKLDIFMWEQVFGECYTPQMGHGISVRDKQATPKGDYSNVLTMIAKIRDEQRRASAFLKMQQRPNDAKRRISGLNHQACVEVGGPCRTEIRIIETFKE